MAGAGARDRAAGAVIALGSLSAGLTHELNNPPRRRYGLRRRCGSESPVCGRKLGHAGRRQLGRDRLPQLVDLQEAP